MTTKPKFYQAVLKPIKGNVLKAVYGDYCTLTMVERMGSEEAKCPECGKNVWMIFAKESSMVQQGGKPYIECMECGYITHL